MRLLAHLFPASCDLREEMAQEATTELRVRGRARVKGVYT